MLPLFAYGNCEYRISQTNVLQEKLKLVSDTLFPPAVIVRYDWLTNLYVFWETGSLGRPPTNSPTGETEDQHTKCRSRSFTHSVFNSGIFDEFPIPGSIIASFLPSPLNPLWSQSVTLYIEPRNVHFLAQESSTKKTTKFIYSLRTRFLELSAEKPVSEDPRRIPDILSINEDRHWAGSSMVLN